MAGECDIVGLARHFRPSGGSGTLSRRCWRPCSTASSRQIERDRRKEVDARNVTLMHEAAVENRG